MPGLDFTSIAGTDAADSATEPRRIFAALPAKASKFSYPRDVQTEVWDRWHERRDESDLVIKMNTGGGKTAVGLSLLKSCLNEGVGPVAYLAPDNYLAEQVRAEADELGLSTTDEPRSAAFQRGDAILVANIYKLVNGKSQFGVQGRGQPIDVGTVLIDDAHACLVTVESQFTLSVPAGHGAYAELLDLFGDDLKGQSAPGYLDLLDGDPVAAVRLPYWSWQDHQSEVLDILHPHRGDDELMWSWPLLVDALQLCDVAVSAKAVEIRPPCPPIDYIPSLRDARRRIYLTATLADNSVLVTHFGADPEGVASPITPRTAGDLGDRMILTPMETHSDVSRDAIRDLLVELSREQNVVIIVPSGPAAHYWAPFAQHIHSAATIQAGVAALRKGHVGLVVLVNKYDGIDLPHDACRVLVIDGLPEAYGPLHRLEAACLTDSDAMVARQIQRIEQGMGRGVRSNDDYCVVLLLGSRLTQRLYHGRMVGMFSPATRAQLELSRRVVQLLEDKPFSELRGVIDQCLNRDAGWVAASRGALDGVRHESDEQVPPTSVAEREAFDLAMVDRHLEASRTLTSVADSALDPRHTGWLKQRAAAYLHQVDPVGADRLQSSALETNRALLKSRAGIPYIRVGGTEPQANLCSQRLAEYGSHDAMVLGLRAIMDDLVPSDDPARTNPFEQAFHDLGEHLGFMPQRPERDSGEGPDVLWSLGHLKYLVVECKSAVTTDFISKSDAAQLSHSIDWFSDKYDSTSSATPVLVHPTRTMHRQATAREGTKIITFDRLADLCASVVEFARSAASIGLYDIAEIAARLNDAGLNAGSFIQRWGQSPRSQ